MKSTGLFSQLPLQLRSAVLAILIATGLVTVWMAFAIHLEHRWTKYIAPETSDLKNQGAVLQKAAFAAKDVMPLYGSSELVKKIPDRASLLFATYPTDFVVSPIGKGGNTSLIMAQKIAASAVANRGHKLAIILSPSWFFVRTANREHYDGNFSALQASNLIFNAPLSAELKRDLALRMIYYPETLTKTSFLDFAIRRQASDRPIDRVILALARPLGWLQNGIFLLQDHTETAISILTDRHKELPKPVQSESSQLPWDQLFEEASREAKPDVRGPTDSYAKAFGGDQEFLQVLNHAHEWGDLELLLRTLDELHLDPLIISIPIQLKHFEDQGISRGAVEVYTHRLQALAEKYDVPLADFVDHQEDNKFFADHHDHLTTKGWIYLDKAIDDFFHAPRRHLHPRRAHVTSNT